MKPTPKTAAERGWHLAPTKLFRSRAYRALTTGHECMQCGLRTSALYLRERKLKKFHGEGRNHTIAYLHRMQQHAQDLTLDITCWHCHIRRIFGEATAKRLDYRTHPNLTLAALQPGSDTICFSDSKLSIIKASEYHEQLRKHIISKYYGGMPPLTTQGKAGALFRSRLHEAIIRHHFAQLCTTTPHHGIAFPCALCSNPTTEYIFDHIESPGIRTAAAITNRLHQLLLYAAAANQNLRLVCEPCDAWRRARQSNALAMLRRWKRGQMFYQTI